MKETKVNRTLQRGREAYDRRAWRDATELLSEAARSERLGEDDLERLAWAAGLAGNGAVLLQTLERLYELRLHAGDQLGAARAAFWLGYRLLSVGEKGRATGWHDRAARLVEREACDCVERGYLLLPEAHRGLSAGDFDAACAAGDEAARIAERFDDANLLALARCVHGRALVLSGRLDEGLRLLDSAMLAAASGTLSHVVTGIAYCSVIDSCQRAFAVERSREWTEALAQWCDVQPQLATFNGTCRVRRSEILQLQGEWTKAIEEAQRAARHVPDTESRETAAAALYQEAEIHRLRGEYELAEGAYRNASLQGKEPQPGLALLRLAQGQVEGAVAAIRHVIGVPREPLDRARYLPAAMEILLAAGDLDAASQVCEELHGISSKMRNPILSAMAAHAQGALRLAEENAQGAVEPLLAAFATWQQIEAPYLAARVRTSLALAYDLLGDREGAELERNAARTVFRELGAAPDLARLDALPQDESPSRPFGLTSRELEVLRLVASGKTNRAIANELFVSEKTIDRHVSNIFAKLDVSTRAAATAFAYKNKLI